MAPTWQEREQAFEAKYAHDETFRFRVTARRDKLFAQWAATQYALDAGAAEALTKSVLAVTDGRGHDQALLHHVAAALSAHGKAVPEAELAAGLNQSEDQARQQLLATPQAAWE